MWDAICIERVAKIGVINVAKIVDKSGKSLYNSGVGLIPFAYFPPHRALMVNLGGEKGRVHISSFSPCLTVRGFSLINT